VQNINMVAKQERMYGRMLYSTHFERVVNNLKEIGIKDEDIRRAGWLHDVI
jgi:hypothetical protein